MKNNIVETILGAAVILAAAGFLTFAVTTANIQKVDGYTVTATFSEATGISPGADVRISGVKVGSLVDMSLDNVTYLAELTMSVKPEIELPTDTVAKIATEGFFGGKYLALEPGGAEDFLQPGDRIQYTQGSVNLEELIGKFIFNGSGDQADASADGSSASTIGGSF